MIRELDIDVHGGFSVITGETGAGKSILLGALALILGQRADSGVQYDAGHKCIIEGHFRVDGYELDNFFRDNDLDPDDGLILRREISPGGKSRAFINDTPVNLQTLKELGVRLVNIHSQNAIITLHESDFQLSVIDSYAGISGQVNLYHKEFSGYTRLKKELEAMALLQARSLADHDYHHFLLEELRAANLQPGELHALEESHKALIHSEEIKTGLFRIAMMLSDDDQAILARMSEILAIIDTLVRFNHDLQAVATRLRENYIDLRDIVVEIQHLEGLAEIDPEEIARQSQRIDMIYRLLKKHNVTTDDLLIQVMHDLEKKVLDVSSLEDQLKKTSEEVIRLEDQLHQSADAISESREKVLPSFEKEVVTILKSLGIKDANFKVESERSTGLTKDGIDKVRFLFNANKGLELKDLASTASGGELSRLMLSIKSMISQKNLLPTIIFDEIDNGVSGEVAGRIGTILKRMGKTMQVVAITHLPQIAGKGEHHYQVYKAVQNERSATFIRPLSVEERISEIARMLSDETISPSALATAKELLNN